MEKRIIQVDEKVPVKLLVPLRIQHIFAMFGATSQREKHRRILDPVLRFLHRLVW